jgi:hypothetical protein
MNKVNFITKPDIIYADCLSILLINPNSAVTSQLQSILLKNDVACNVYFYDDSKASPEDIDWILKTFKLANVCIFDLDQSGPELRQLASYIIAKPKTYWLTNAEDSVYNHLSRNRVYNLDFLSTIGGYFETEQQ